MNKIELLSSKMIAKRKYLDKIPISEEDKQAIIKHHLEKAKIRDSRLRKVIFEQTKIKPFSLERIETKGKLFSDCLDMILNKHHRDSNAQIKPIKNCANLVLSPIRNPTALASSPKVEKLNLSALRSKTRPNK